jgi:DNA-binding NtrC family response regulator
VIILTGPGEHDSAEEALRRGAADYFSRPIDLRRLRHVLPRIVRAAALETTENRADVPVAVQSMDAAKEAAIRTALSATAGNVKEAARRLGIGRTTIYKLMERYGIVARASSDDGM